MSPTRHACARCSAIALNIFPRDGVVMTAAQITRTDVLGTVSLLDAVVAIDGYRPRVIIGSSGGVYGALDDDQLPASESAPCVPVDVHGASKHAAEHMAHIVGERHGGCVVAGRIFNVIGPGQDGYGRLAAHLRPGDGEIRVGNLGATRDFIDVRDVASALAFIGERGACGEAYNVSSGDEMPSTGTVAEDDSLQRTPRVPRYYGDATRLRELGFVPRHRIEDTLRDPDRRAASLTLRAPEQWKHDIVTCVAAGRSLRGLRTRRSSPRSDSGIDSDFATLLRTVVIVAILGAFVPPPASGAILLAAPRSVLFPCCPPATASWVCYFRALKLGDASSSHRRQAQCGAVALFAVTFHGERPAAQRMAWHRHGSGRRARLEHKGWSGFHISHPSPYCHRHLEWLRHLRRYG